MISDELIRYVGKPTGGGSLSFQITVASPSRRKKSAPSSPSQSATISVKRNGITPIPQSVRGTGVHAPGANVTVSITVHRGCRIVHCMLVAGLQDHLSILSTGNPIYALFIINHVVDDKLS